ncbi:MAG: hypothetical protein QGG33_04885, partial [Candidatus Krumholzibacteria bacterium]|nr:hypothetical protein [Candidatus Krumholzibacteria bacterium]
MNGQKPRALFVFLIVPCFAFAGDLDARLSTGWQSNRSSLQEMEGRLLNFDLRVDALVPGDLGLDFDLSGSEDLTGSRKQARGAIDWAGLWLDCRAEGGVSEYRPGEWSLPLYTFDPESLLILEQASQKQVRSEWSLQGGFLGDRHETRLSVSREELAFESPDSLYSDRADYRMMIEGALFFEKDWLLEYEAELLKGEFLQRSYADFQERGIQIRGSRPTDRDWSLELECGFRHREVQDVEGLSSYEEPGGRVAKLGLIYDLFRESGLEANANVSLIREDWNEYEGYYRDGDGFLAELFLSHSPGGAVRMEAFYGQASFDPDHQETESWILRRSGEKEKEVDLVLRWLPDRPFSLSTSLMADDSRMLDEDEDRFFSLHWQGSATYESPVLGLVSLSLSLDDYQSHYGEEPVEREEGLSWSASWKRKW